MTSEKSCDRCRPWHQLPGRIALAAFVVAQVCDGLLTYAGIARFGADIEANPLVGWYVYEYGPGAAVVGAKAFAVLCAFPLFWQGMCRTITVLAGLYIAIAILPWSHLLWP
jgi:hypothetical protein